MPSITRAMFGMGSVAGVGFGLFVASKNFDVGAHQSAEMHEATRFFAEMLTQSGLAMAQGLSLGIGAAIVGALLDCLTRGRFCAKEERDSFKEYLPLMNR